MQYQKLTKSIRTAPEWKQNCRQKNETSNVFWNYNIVLIARRCCTCRHQFARAIITCTTDRFAMRYRLLDALMDFRWCRKTFKLI
jgi:hypothetical protein